MTSGPDDRGRCLCSAVGKSCRLLLHSSSSWTSPSEQKVVLIIGLLLIQGSNLHARSGFCCDRQWRHVGLMRVLSGAGYPAALWLSGREGHASFTIKSYVYRCTRDVFCPLSAATEFLRLSLSWLMQLWTYRCAQRNLDNMHPLFMK